MHGSILATTLLLLIVVICLDSVTGMEGNLVEIYDNFSADPGWHGRGNQRTVGCTAVVQDFGYSMTNHAGDATGELGGRISRSTMPAHYAMSIDSVGFDDALMASGSICLVENRDGGTFVGWFNASRQGWRPVNFIGFRLDEANVHLAYTTGTWKAHGLKTGITLAPGKKYPWNMAYDPSAAGGGGAITLTIDGENHTLELLEGHREEGAHLNRFGIFNLQEPGGYQCVFIDDLFLPDFSSTFFTDPGWEGSGNRATFTDCELRGTQGFGFSNTSFAGGESGEVGGLIWRTESHTYYAAEVGLLTLDDFLSASGRLAVTQASSDSGFLFGWFNDSHRGWPPSNFLGFVVEGPSRIGHYFRLIWVDGQGRSEESEENPIIYPNGTKHVWTLTYDPHIRLFSGVLDGLFVVNVSIPKGFNASFNRFGMLNLQVDGHQMSAYLDDLNYTSLKVDEAFTIIIIPGALLFSREIQRHIYRNLI